MDSKSTGHVVVGAIVSFVFLAYPGGPFLGGGLAGYLEGKEVSSGIRVGVTAGIVVLAASMVLSAGDVLLGIDEFGFADLLWDGIYHPVREGMVPLVVLPLIGGGIGAYVRGETTR